MPRWLSLVERVTRNLVVVGSIPTRGFIHELGCLYMNKCINKPIHEDITFDALYIEYIHYRNLRPETIRSYTRKLTIYSNITGMTLTQLIEEAESDEDLGIRKRLKKNQSTSH